MDLTALTALVALFIALPWIVLHYVTQWKRNSGLSREDEKFLDELHETARRLDDRVATIERLYAADHPDYRPSIAARTPPSLDTEMAAIDHAREEPR